MKTINSIKKAGFSPLTGNWVIRPNISISMIIAFCLFQSPYGESGNTTRITGTPRLGLPGFQSPYGESGNTTFSNASLRAT